jgi:hypothetical protein
LAACPDRWALLATAGILAVAVAVTCLAGAVQLRPIPATELNRMVAAAVEPAAAQHCTTTTTTGAGQVRYCLYPGFGPQLPAIQAPVSAVLAYLPARLAQPLTVRQAAPVPKSLPPRPGTASVSAPGNPPQNPVCTT